MAEVTIPEEAWTAALPSDEDIRRANGIPAAIRVLAEETVRAAAPLIVAAELDRQADSFQAISYHRVADSLRDRAEELRASVLRGEGQSRDD